MTEPAPFPVVKVTGAVEDEQAGSKRKFWSNDDDGHRMLFKYGRPGTGENWAEKIAAEVADLLMVPHAQVELAEFEGERGIVSYDVTEGLERGALVHGNELLTWTSPGYDMGSTFRNVQHTLARVLDALARDFIYAPRGHSCPVGLERGVEVFVGYLLLDALIGNTDRHHQNWAVLVPYHAPGVKLRAELSPSFDHASSLGRELPEARQRELLSGRWPDCSTLRRACPVGLLPPGVGREADEYPGSIPGGLHG